MEIIYHRRNSIASLKETSINYGVEVDLRSNGNNLITSHDPYEVGNNFIDWLKFYKHRTLIINVKEEGLERKIIYFLNKFNIKSYFFLDQSFPFLLKTSEDGNPNCAVRVSEYESIHTALNLENKIKWVWVDMFNKFPLTYENYIDLKKANFKLCLVSPELQISNKMNINEIKNFLKRNNFVFDAVCTKFPENWQ